MDAKLQRRIQRYGWDAAAIYYHADWSDQLRPAQDTLLKMANLQAGQAVLETACGTGMVTVRAARAVGPTGRVFATDLSEEMTRQIVQQCEAQNIANVSVARMGAEDLHVEDDSFDAAICALGLMYVPDPRKALTEMARTVRPGGKVTATIWGERKNCRWAEIFPIVDARVASEVCPMFFASGAPGALQKDFEAAGLTDIREMRQTETLNFVNAVNLSRAMMLGGPVAMAVKRFDDVTMADVRREFLNSVASFRTTAGGYAIPGEFVTVCATVPK